MSQFVENIQAVGEAAVQDYGESSWSDRARMLGSAALWPAHELGMETAIAAVGTHALEYTHNALAVGAAMGSLSLGVETTLAYLIAHNMQSFKGAVATIRERYYPEAPEADELEAANQQEKNRVAQAIDTGALALSLGSPGVMLRDFSRDPDRSYEENKRTGLRAGRSLAAFNFVLGTFLAGGGWVAEKLGTNAVTDAIINIGESPITYASIFGIVVGPRVWSIRQARKQRREAAQAAELNHDTLLAEEASDV